MIWAGLEFTNWLSTDYQVITVANVLCMEKVKWNPFEIPREQYCKFDPCALIVCSFVSIVASWDKLQGLCHGTHIKVWYKHKLLLILCITWFFSFRLNLPKSMILYIPRPTQYLVLRTWYLSYITLPSSALKSGPLGGHDTVTTKETCLMESSPSVWWSVVFIFIC